MKQFFFLFSLSYGQTLKDLISVGLNILKLLPHFFILTDTYVSKIIKQNSLSRKNNFHKQTIPSWALKIAKLLR